MPTKPHLLHPGVGPLGWIQFAEPLTLPMSVCLEGVQLTVKQIKHLLEELGVHFEKNLKKNQLQILLIKSCLQEGEEQENAIAKISEATEGRMEDQTWRKCWRPWAKMRPIIRR